MNPCRNATTPTGSAQTYIMGVVLLILCGVLISSSPGCGLFEPRTPEAPSQPSLNSNPPTDPTIVIANLQSAIDQKNVANYISCFADPLKTTRTFVFTASADASALYAGVLSSWTRDEEQSYFQNLIARSPSGAFASLLLTLKSSTVTPDSVVYNYDYTFTFEHADPGFPKTARGNLQFTLATDNNNFWMIYRWIDYKTTNDATWSLFKGKFAN